MGRTNVIIPFYQRDRGILPRAVNSALAQGIEDLLVTVIDDGSPVPAHEEIADILARDPRVIIIEQKNAGPGAARNAGLDATPGDTEFIAFLDSDDRWLPGHLANGLTAMRAGADFYFSNHSLHGSNRLRFPACGAYAPAGGIPIPEGTDSFFYEGDLVDALLQVSPVGTSTVIFARKVAPNLRFPGSLSAGEDDYFWVGLSHAAARIAYSSRGEVVYGRGVNISVQGMIWGSDEALRERFDHDEALRLIATDFPLSRRQRGAVETKRAT